MPKAGLLMKVLCKRTADRYINSRGPTQVLFHMVPLCSRGGQIGSEWHCGLIGVILVVLFIYFFQGDTISHSTG